MKRAVQQTLIEFTKPSVLNRGIREYNFSHPVLSDTEEEKKNNCNIGESSRIPGSNHVAPLGCGGISKGTSKRSREESRSQQRRETSHHQQGAKELILVAPEEDPRASH